MGRVFARVGRLAALMALAACSSETFRTIGPTGTLEDGGVAEGGPIATNDGSLCGDTSSDSNHCGACGHACLGGACTKGRCQPITLATSADLPSTLALDANRFYVGLQGGNGGVLACSLAGCPPGAGPLLTSFLAGGIAVDKDAVYVARLEPLGEIFRSAKGTTVKAAVTTGDVTALLRSASDGLYIASDGSGANQPTLSRFEASQTVPIAVTSSPIRGIALTTDHVVWTEPGAKRVLAARKDRKTPVDQAEIFLPTEGASGPGARGITVVGNRVFVAGHVQGNILRCVFGPTCSSPEALAVGGEPTLLAGDDPGQKLYWYDTSTKAIRGCQVSQCEKTQADLVTGIPDVFDLAVGTDAVYFTVRAQSGGVYRIAK